MDTLRRRIPFKLGDDEGESREDEVLDEQQQEALVEKLRKDNERANEEYLTALKLVVGLSLVLHCISFQHNPILTIFPPSHLDPSLPLTTIFSLLSLSIHSTFFMSLFPNEIRLFLELPQNPHPPPPIFLYSLAFVAPTFSFFLQKPWQTTAWWLVTPFMVFLTQTVLDAIEKGNQGISDLEHMKYVSPGA